MSKRVIHECDLTKIEFDPTEEKIFMLTIAVKGRKAPMKYELSAPTAEKLLVQLNGSEALSSDWSFSKTPVAKIKETASTRRTLGDLDDGFEDDSYFVAQKKQELKAQGVIDAETPREQPDVGIYQDKVSDGSCRHINKSRVNITMRGKKRFVYRKCKECNKEIEETTKADKDKFMNGKLPAGVNMQDYNK